MALQADARLFVVTGGPGSGKSTLLAAMSAEGFAHMPEGGRAIIQDQVAIGGTALPWADRHLFAELMLSWDLRSWADAHQRAGPILFDRGIPDVIGYLELCSLPVPLHVEEAAARYRYARTVFVAPPWIDIFGQDAERKQSFGEAEATYEAMMRVYRRLDYDLVQLPCASVADRVRFVRAMLEATRR